MFTKDMGIEEYDAGQIDGLIRGIDSEERT